MKTPRKAVVSKRVSEDEKINSLRWTFFLSQCKIEWDELTETSKDFFAVMGNTQSSEDDINNAMDLARNTK